MDPTVELWLVRHGETEASAARRLAGQSDPPLTDRGRREAVALAPLLRRVRFDAVWASDLGRAVETARLAWGEPRLDRRLRELDFGDWEGTCYDGSSPGVGEVLVAFRDFAVPGGETSEQLRDRVRAFVDALPPGRHLVFTHGGVIRQLTGDLGLDRFVPTGSVVRLDWSGRSVLGVERPGGDAGEPVGPRRQPE